MRALFHPPETRRVSTESTSTTLAALEAELAASQLTLESLEDESVADDGDEEQDEHAPPPARRPRASRSKKPPDKTKVVQLRLSAALVRVLLNDLKQRLGRMPGAKAGERRVGGGLRAVQADVSQVTESDGVTLAVEIKPVHLAVGRSIWNRFGNIRSFAVNIHLKFPFAVVAAVTTYPDHERIASGDDAHWKSTTHLIARAVSRFERAAARDREDHAPHLLEGTAVVVFDYQTGIIDQTLPPQGSALRWQNFVDRLCDLCELRFDEA